MSWTTVMATGIVSVDLHDGGWNTPSLVLLAVAAMLWAALLAQRAPLGEPAAVAATAVLGTRAAAGGWTVVAWPLLGGAAALWARQAPWRPPSSRSGSAFLPTVATQSVAVLLATLAATRGARWLEAVALVLIAGGLALYAYVLTRFDGRELLGGDGDHWVAGGALAISALACATLRPGLVGGQGAAALVLWVAAMAWLPALVAGELLRPRAGALPTRWSTVFPLGMYAAMSFAVDRRDGLWALRVFAQAWTWVAVAAWLAVLVTAIASRRRAARPMGAWRGRDGAVVAARAPRDASARHMPRR